MNSPTSNAGPRANCVRRLLIVPTAAALLLWVSNSSSRGQEAPAARPVGADSATAQPTRDFVELLKLEAERSEKAMQATADSMRAYTDLLRAEAGRSEQATRHEIDMIERTLAKFTYIIGGLGAVLLFFGWGNIRDIRRRAADTVQKEIEKLTNAADTKIKEHVDLAQSTFTQQIGVEQDKFREKSDAFGKEIAEMKQRSQEQTSELNEFIVSTKDDLTKSFLALVSRRQALARTTTGVAQPLEKWVIWVDDQPMTTLTARKELERNGIQVEAVQSIRTWRSESRIPRRTRSSI